MIGRIFSVFLNSYSESLKLQARYRKLTTRLGLVTVAISCLVMVVLMYQLWLMVGLPLEGGKIDGFRLKLVSWVVLTVLFVPLAFYAGMVVVNGGFGLIMFALGRFSWRQAIDFALRAKYPKHWYLSDSD